MAQATARITIDTRLFMAAVERTAAMLRAEAQQTATSPAPLVLAATAMTAAASRRPFSRRRLLTLGFGDSHGR